MREGIAMSEDKKHVEDAIEAIKARTGFSAKNIEEIRLSQERNRKHKAETEITIQRLSQYPSSTAGTQALQAAQEQIARLDEDFEFWNDLLQGKIQEQHLRSDQQKSAARSMPAQVQNDAEELALLKQYAEKLEHDFERLHLTMQMQQAQYLEREEQIAKFKQFYDKQGEHKPELLEALSFLQAQSEKNAHEIAELERVIELQAKAIEIQRQQQVEREETILQDQIRMNAELEEIIKASHVNIDNPIKTDILSLKKTLPLRTWELEEDVEMKHEMERPAGTPTHGEETERTFQEGLTRLEAENEQVLKNIQEAMSIAAALENELSKNRARVAELEQEKKVLTAKLESITKAKKNQEELDEKQKQEAKRVGDQLAKIESDINDLTLEHTRKLAESRKQNHQIRQELERVQMELATSKKQNLTLGTELTERFRKQLAPFEREIFTLTEALDTAQEEALQQAIKFQEQKDWMEESQTLRAELSQARAQHAATLGKLTRAEAEVEVLRGADSKEKSELALVNQELLKMQQARVQVQSELQSLYSKLDISNSSNQQLQAKLQATASELMELQQTSEQLRTQMQLEGQKNGALIEEFKASQERFARTTEKLMQQIQSERSEHERNIAELRSEHEEASRVPKTEIERLKREIQEKTAHSQETEREVRRIAAENEGLKELLQTNKQSAKDAISTLKSENKDSADRISALAKKSSNQTVKIGELEQELGIKRQQLQHADGAITDLQIETHQQAEKIHGLQYALSDSRETVRQNVEITQALQSTIGEKDREIEKLQQAMALFKAQMQAKDKQIADMSGHHAQQIVSLRTEHEEAVSDLRGQNANLQKLVESTKQNAKDMALRLAREYKETQDHTAELEKIATQQKSKIIELEQAFSGAKHQVDASQEANRALERQNHTLVENTNSLRHQLNQSQEQLARNEADITSLRREFAQSESENTETVQALRMHIRELEREQGQTQKTTGTLERELHHKNQEISELKGVYERAQAHHIAYAKTTEARVAEITQTSERRVQHAEAQIAQTQAQMQEAMREIQRLRGIQTENGNLATALAATRSEHERAKEELRRKDRELAEVRAQIRESQENNERASRVAQANAERQIQQLQARLAQTQHAEQLANVNSLAVADEAKRNDEERRQHIANLEAQLVAYQHRLRAQAEVGQAGAGQQPQQPQQQVQQPQQQVQQVLQQAPQQAAPAGPTQAQIAAQKAAERAGRRAGK